MPLFVVSLIFGFFVAKMLAGKGVHKEGVLPNLYLRNGKNKILLHHWTYFFVFSAIISFVQIGTNILPEDIFISVLGFFLGAGCQGLIYKDWNRFK